MTRQKVMASDVFLQTSALFRLCTVARPADGSLLSRACREQWRRGASLCMPVVRFTGWDKHCNTPQTSRPALGVNPLSSSVDTAAFPPGLKRPGLKLDHTPR